MSQTPHTEPPMIDYTTNTADFKHHATTHGVAVRNKSNSENTKDAIESAFPTNTATIDCTSLKTTTQFTAAILKELNLTPTELSTAFQSDTPLIEAALQLQETSLIAHNITAPPDNTPTTIERKLTTIANNTPHTIHVGATIIPPTDWEPTLTTWETK